MNESADTLADRARLKKDVRRWRMLTFASLLGGLLLFGVWQTKSTSTDYIARVTIEGFIGDDIKRDQMFADLAADSSAKAVILRMDSPGGTALGGEELYRQIRDVAQKKPVVAIMRTACTSACYMAAIGADSIFALDSSITGSIGVLLEMAEVTELAKKLGIEPISVKSGNLKASPSPFEKFTPENKEYIQTVVDSSFAMFINLVKTRRTLNDEVITYISDGRVLTGTEAKKIKIIDHIGGEKEALQWLQKQKQINAQLNVEDVEPAKDPEDWLGALEQSASRLFLGHMSQRLDGLISVWQPIIK